jgi:transcriptional regulator with XRE-family HTH domain
MVPLFWRHHLKRVETAEQKALMEAVVEAREATGLDQRSFAARLERDDGFVWKMEIGTRRPRIVELIEIGWAAGIRPDSFIDRIVSRRPLVRAKEKRIRIPLTQSLRDFMEETLIAETVTARTRKGVEKSQRQVGAEIDRSVTYVWKLENRLLTKGLEVLEYLALSKVEGFDPTEGVAKVARAAVAKVTRGG